MKEIFLYTMTPKITVLTSHVDISRSFSHNLTQRISEKEAKREKKKIDVTRKEIPMTMAIWASFLSLNHTFEIIIFLAFAKSSQNDRGAAIRKEVSLCVKEKRNF
jgi:hypothetical protein